MPARIDKRTKIELTEYFFTKVDLVEYLFSLNLFFDFIYEKSNWNAVNIKITFDIQN